MKKVKGLVAGSLLACVAAGCASVSDVRVQQADVDFATCRSFDWLPASNDAASFSEQRVRTAVMQTLERKGYTQSAEQPDCRITYVLATREQPKAKPSVGVGAGGGSGGMRGGIGVSIPIGQKDQHVGEFTLDVIDTAAKVQIWSGSLDIAVSGAELTEDEARAVVDAVLAKFPDRAAATQ